MNVASVIREKKEGITNSKSMLSPNMHTYFNIWKQMLLCEAQFLKLGYPILERCEN